MKAEIALSEGIIGTNSQNNVREFPCKKGLNRCIRIAFQGVGTGAAEALLRSRFP
jgi:hypothetical protein